MQGGAGQRRSTAPNTLKYLPKNTYLRIPNTTSDSVRESKIANRDLKKASIRRIGYNFESLWLILPRFRATDQGSY